MLENQPEKSKTSASQRLVWHQGSVLPYSSLWSVVHRLSYLNLLNAVDLRYFGLRQHGYAGMNSLITNYKVIDIPSLAQAMQEPMGLFRHSTLESLSPWTHHLFQIHSLRFCPDCLKHGFHSIFHNLLLLSRCPIHETPLEDRCVCGRSISACLNSDLYLQPGQCVCGRPPFWSVENTRMPSLDPQTTKVFDEVSMWIQASSDRVSMMCVPEPWRNSTGEGDLIEMISTWSKLAGERIPECLETEINSDETSEPWVLGGPFSVEKSAKPSTERMRPRLAVFSAVDRYFRRHLLQGQYWTSRFAMSCDVDYIQACINEHPNARLTWSYLLWLMNVFGVTELRVLRSTSAKFAYANGMNFQGIYPYRSANLLDGPKADWVEMHAAAAFLTTMWRESVQLGLGAVAKQYVEWGHGTISPKGLFRWAAASLEQDRMRFSVKARPGVSLSAHQKPGHKVSNKHAHIGTGSRALESMPKVGVIKCKDQNWISGRLSLPLATEADSLKLRKLFGVNGDLHFVVFSTFGSAGREFVARLKEHSVEAHGVTEEAAIGMLRTAASQYLDTFMHEPTFGNQAFAGPQAHVAGQEAEAAKPKKASWPIQAFASDWPAVLRGRWGKWKSEEANDYSASDDFEAVQAWIQSVADSLSDKTLRTYSRQIERFIFWVVKIKQSTISNLEPKDLLEFAKFLTSPPADWIQPIPYLRTSADWRPFRKPLEGDSLVLAISVVKNMYADFAYVGYLTRDLMLGLNVDYSNKQYFWLTRNDWKYINSAIERLEDEPVARRVKAAIALLRDCGMSLKEAVTAKYGDIYQSEGNYTVILKEKSTPKRFPMSQATFDLLDLHRRDRAELSQEGRLGRYADVPEREWPLIGPLYFCIARDLRKPELNIPTDAASARDSIGHIEPRTLRKAILNFMTDLAETAGSGLAEGFLSRVSYWFVSAGRQTEKKRVEILVRKRLGLGTNVMVDTPEVEDEETSKLVHFNEKKT
jgi:site-specific recombinase XerD